jgi:hypothetical protein
VKASKGGATIGRIVMTYEEILRELASLPPEGQLEAADFITSLHKRYSRSVSAERDGRDLKDLGFVGMWRDRDDMRDSTAWVRTLREREWVK